MTLWEITTEFVGFIHQSTSGLGLLRSAEF